jgi:uncharacterized protein YjiS (DUF1127 family)
MSSSSWDTSIAPSSVPAENGSVLRPGAGVARHFVVSVGSGATDVFYGDSQSRLPSVKTLLAAPWDDWKNEREIQKATRALAEFNDHTLRDLGIADRSQIEFTVRFCREC